MVQSCQWCGGYVPRGDPADCCSDADCLEARYVYRMLIALAQLQGSSASPLHPEVTVWDEILRFEERKKAVLKRIEPRRVRNEPLRR